MMFNVLGRPKGLAAFAAASTIAIVASISSAHAQEQQRQFNIPAQSLSSALLEFSRQSDIPMAVDPTLVNGKRAPAVVGTFTPREALNRLLAGSGITATQRPDGGFVLADTSSATRLGAADRATSGEEEIVVTGSRLAGSRGPRAVDVYSRERIDQSGQGTVGDFLNTLPTVSTSTTEAGLQRNYMGSSTVTLRGLPFGTTLVLVNGRRVQSAGIQVGARNDFFDLNNLPVAAVERIEVLADGSSAVYGSDAIAGVVNIILRSNFEGAEINTGYSWADGTDDAQASLAFGRRWDRASFTGIVSYQTRSTLTSNERALTADNDYTRFGGPNANLYSCPNANVFSLSGAPLPGTPVGGTGEYAAVTGTATTAQPTLADFSYDTLNQCQPNDGFSIIPDAERFGIFAQGTFQLTDTIELFTEQMFSHNEQHMETGRAFAFGIPGFQSFTVSADNPYNPFGVAVGVAGAFPEVRQGQSAVTDFYRSLIGARGQLPSDWDWEVAAVYAQDESENPLINQVMDVAAFQTALDSPDPAVALNPFTGDPWGSAEYIRSFFTTQGARDYSSSNLSISGFVRGDIFALPAGDLDVVVGAEYQDAALERSISGAATEFTRDSSAVFAEARIPLLAAAGDDRDLLALTAAGRYDRYSDFGDTTNPQVGLEFRPHSSLLLRANYSTAFKAPPLPTLYAPQSDIPNALIDPLTGNLAVPVVRSGGNPDLQPLTGESFTAGLDYTSSWLPGLRIGLTYWAIREEDVIQTVGPQFILNNESAFPDRVVRDGAGNLTFIDNSSVNFGEVDVAGVDFRADYSWQTSIGLASLRAAATNTINYDATLVPGGSSTSGLGRARNSGNWAPRWKGSVGGHLDSGPFAVDLSGRYVSAYIDYDGARELGNFWLFDANAKISLTDIFSSDSENAHEAYLELGAVNLLDEEVQFSSFLDGGLGYDPAQADIRGRYIYTRLGVRF